jgi:hypothetical protein
MMQAKPSRPRKSRKFYIVSGAIIWATPMSIFFGFLFWKLEALTIPAAFLLICMSVVVGFGVAAVIYGMVRARYGPARDND